MQSRSVSSVAGDGCRDGYAEKRDRYVQGRIADGCALAAPELRRANWADVLYRIRDRQGIDVTAVPACALHAEPAGALRDDLGVLLARAVYDLAQPTLLIVSGVSPYLPEPAVSALVAFTSAHTSPS